MSRHKAWAGRLNIYATSNELRMAHLRRMYLRVLSCQLGRRHSQGMSEEATSPCAMCR